MTVSKHDLRHGRQGGRIVDFDRPELSSGTCDVCGGPTLVGQRGRHSACDERSIVGRRCICRPGCTDVYVGDAGACEPECEVCNIMRGVAHADVQGWKRRSSDAGDSQPAEMTLFGGDE